MKQQFNWILLIVITAFALSCNSEANSKNAKVTEKQNELKKKKEDAAKLAAEIKKLESDIAIMDPSTVKAEKPKLVAVAPLSKENFTHFIDLQGTVDAENISYVAPRGPGGQVKAVYVKKGDYVKKGQLLLKLDDAIVRQNIETAETQLSYAENLYQRQKNLWDQNIGTEVQLITAQNNVDQAKRNIATLKEQLSFSNVYADVSGVADEVNVRVGEYFQGASPQGTSQIKIVNTSSLKAVTNIPENYLDRVKKGTPVVISIPDLNKTFKSTISYIGQSIGLTSRGFSVESRIPNTAGLKPNQVAMIKIQDYTSPNSISIPLNTLQTDEKGKYVLVASNEKGKLYTRKRSVDVGELYGDKIEIRKGLEEGDSLITEGFQGLYEGQLITTAGQ
ncbi:MAG TPA: efflux RND transporter periplasmic adaptor subunit [Chitinophagaceae bacterium]|jgi:RND family efflux transporter MFP subunit|nr:efflux RND transporter periplasmic adaptor subunit [Chitinophagaceae bacterium]